MRIFGYLYRQKRSVIILILSNYLRERRTDSYSQKFITRPPQKYLIGAARVGNLYIYIYILTNLLIHTYMYIHIYICICVCIIFAFVDIS